VEQNTDSFWELVENTQEKSGPFAALILIMLFGVFYFGSVFLAAWAVSATFGSGYWMTLLSIMLLKLVWG
jgi:hypothetical protein